MINNRQNGRRRGRGGQQRVGGGNPGRPESGNKIDNRARGNASQLYEKYKALAGDAQRQGDRVNIEYYLQFADHYFRVLAESRPREEQQARARGTSDFDDEFDGDGEDFGQEGEPGQPDQYPPRADDRYRQEARQDLRPNQQDGRQSQERPPHDRQVQERQPQERQFQDRQPQDRQPQDRQNQDERPRQQSRQDARSDDRPRRDDRPRQDRQDARPEQSRADQSRFDQPRSDQVRPEERPRQDRPRRDGAQDQRPRDDRYARAERQTEPPVADAPASAEEVSMMADERLTPLLPETPEASTVRAADMDAPVPRRRGRPPKVRPEEAIVAARPEPMLAEPIASEPSGFDADRLPPSLSVSASAEPDAGEPAEKPRRRRRVATGPVEAGPAS